MTEKRTLLIVDDDQRNIYALKVVLSLQGFEILTAGDGHQCLDVLDREPHIDAVLMDIMMPGMDGYETIRAVRSQERFKALPIIAVTAQAMVGDREKCLEAGATDYVSKPIDAAQLVQVLNKYLPKTI